MKFHHLEHRCDGPFEGKPADGCPIQWSENDLKSDVSIFNNAECLLSCVEEKRLAPFEMSPLMNEQLFLFHQSDPSLEI